eukprot:753327-Hanusia_phi.AAC.1
MHWASLKGNLRVRRRRRRRRGKGRRKGRRRKNKLGMGTWEVGGKRTVVEEGERERRRKISF